MGSYCNLFVGDTDFSWKGIVPEVTGLLFQCSDYRSSPIQPEDDGTTPESRAFEHRFITDCGSAKQRLVDRGISLDFLRALHVWAFGFDSDAFRNSLEFRCESYLKEKLGERFRDDHVHLMVRRLMRLFHRLSQEEEFAHVLDLRQCKGTIKGYYARMEVAIEEARNRDDDERSEFDMLKFSRDRLREFIKMDPYDNRGEDLYDDRTAGAVDLDVLYIIAMAIFASPDDVPIEMEFTEIVDARPPFTEQEVSGYLDGLLDSLKSRAAHFFLAFGNLFIAPSRDASRAVVIPTVGRTAKERGDVFEDFTERIFENEPGFTVHRNVRKSDQEIDIVVLNRIPDPFWASLQSPFLLVECRNRRLKVQAKDVRDFEIKLLNSSALARIGLIVSMSGFTKECSTSSVRSCREGYRILLADRAKVMSRLHNHQSTKEWLEQLLVEQL